MILTVRWNFQCPILCYFVMIIENKYPKGKGGVSTKAMRYEQHVNDG